jgi:beta-phosphoglucomutase
MSTLEGAVIKAVLFDMDGVLIDAKDWHYVALNKALANFGYSISRESHLTTFDGLPTKVKLGILSEASGLPVGLHACINEIKQRHTLELSQQLCRPEFQHQFALSRLKRNGLKLAVCSNSIRQTVETMMRQASLLEYLDLVLSNEDVVKSKPDPKIYVTAMKWLGVEPAETLILEDNDHGIAAALASGAHLLRIGSPSDVSFANIQDRIEDIEINGFYQK